ncbi:MAG TPA: DUF2298 domain-containing protein [Anaerolineales bacterium]|nr:DUF2298 domain-containing protein [Anaerolineales bacterium]
MLQFLAWYLLVTFLGWLTFPLAFRLFPALSDRGFSLARALGMLVWGYVFWMLASLGILQNDGGGLLVALLALAALSASTLLRKERRLELLEWIRANRRTVLMVELLFFLAFALWAFVRASNPNIETAGGEKTMELAFINAILRSPTFPPRDPWLSGYAISYYYFGYVMAAMLARATGTPGAMAHNLMTSLVFALSFIGAYGIIYNLLAARRARQAEVPRKKNRPAEAPPKPSLGLPLLGPLFLLFVSNVEGFLEVLHSKGLFWKFNADGSATSAFWSWLGIKNLVDPPVAALSWIPSRFIWWWQGSRVIQDYDFAHNWREIIDEFPAFSYLLGDLHPHVLAMPFGLLAVAVALNLFLGGWKGETNFRFFRLPVHAAGLFFGALILGGLAFLNTWDILLGFALMAGAFVLMRVGESGWSWKRLEDLFSFGVPVGLAAILLYLPFYAGFQSQAGGILPNIDSPTRGAQLWVMFAPLFLGIIAYLLVLWRSEKRPAKWWVGLALAAGLILALWLFSWLMAFVALKLEPDFVTSLVDSECSGSVLTCFVLSNGRRLMYSGGLLTLFGLLGAALAFVIGGYRSVRVPDAGTNAESADGSPAALVNIFVLMLIVLGSVLVIAPEFVFLRDLFSNRMNTIFKFYYQAWMVWSLASAFGVAVILERLKAWKGTFAMLFAGFLLVFVSLNVTNPGLQALLWIASLAVFVSALIFGSRRDVRGSLFHVGLSLLMVVSLTYPILGLGNKANDLQIPAFFSTLKSARAAGDPKALQDALQVWTLDGSRLFSDQYPDDAAAARWLLTAPDGVIAEAVGGSYTDYARMAAYSGLPDVIGWTFHEWQWRGTFDEQVSPIQNLNCISADGGPRKRGDDIRCLYETSSWDDASTILTQYNVRYVVVGTMELRTYHVNDAKFKQHLTQVFSQGDVVIYEVPSQ